MNKDIYTLMKKFNYIKNCGWIKSMRGGNGGIGYTFETLIGKTEENFPIPDFNSIEIKTIHEHSKTNKITLFSLTPDGDYLFPIERIQKELGYPDKDIPDKNILHISVNAKEFKSLGCSKAVGLKLNREEKKLSLLAFIYCGNIIDLDTSWSFKAIEDRINLKMKNLAIITAKSTMFNNEEYFLYDKIEFYKLKSFKIFLDLLEKGIIDVNFKISVFKKGPKYGKTHDRGTCFSININDLDLLYEKISL